MPEEPLSLHSNMASTFIQVHDSNPNPNSNPNSNPAKKKRNLPGNPDPDAEVIALSPKSLMATNRFICEICKKGFQRDQNLQLHRRGHNLPWKLKQRNKQDVIRKKVYVCPEKSCVHHDPCRALGDLTGIKKHFSRKHGEKKWKCTKCSKKYAVQSDWKAHTKICGTREYKCECGTIFSRRDSFITHRAFCGALAEQSARIITSVPAVLCDFRSNNHLINNNTQLASRIPITEFHHQEFGGSGTEQLIGNFVDAEHSQKLRLPIWLDQANSHHHQLQHPFGVTSNNNNPNELVQTTMNMNMNINMYGSSSSSSHQHASQFLNYRYQETSPSFTNANLSLPIAATAMSQGLKQEQEENKGNLSHHGVISSLYSSDQNGGPTHHMSSTIPMESTRVNDNVFGMLGSPNNNNNNNNNCDNSQKFFKQGNIIQQSGENFNNHNMVVVSSINDAISSSCFGNLDHMVMPAGVDEEQLGLTRDFLGVGDNEALRTPFLQQELAKFNPIS